MEAAACGVASVLSDIRGCREVGRDGESLLLVPPRDEDALTAAVDRLLVDERAALAGSGAALGRRPRRSSTSAAVAAISIETYAAVARRRGLAWEGL